MLSSKEFNDKLQSNNFDYLEKEYQNAKKSIKASAHGIKMDDISNNFPAYQYSDNIIMIKFPTYKIRVTNLQMTQNELEKILKGVGNYQVYEEGNVFSYPELKPIKSIAIHCLEDDLINNERTAVNIEKKLKENKIYCERVVSYGVYPMEVSVDGSGYIF